MSATISADGRYRYDLRRRWSDGPAAVWIMLNPSTADAELDDPTIRRCAAFSKAWGCGSLVVVNLYAWRATKPAELKVPDRDVVGPENDRFIREAVSAAVASGSPIVAAWGANAGESRVAEVTALVREAGGQLQCLGTTKSGQPRHPLYVAAATVLEPFGAAPQLRSVQPATSSYAAFLESKIRFPPANGFDVPLSELHPSLFGFQAHIDRWAIHRGRAAIWADTGLGKTRMQVEWATQIGRLAERGRQPRSSRGLILAPLAVCRQTVAEAAALDVGVQYVRDQAHADRSLADVVITNYERLHLFDPAEFDAVVLDEASVIKDVTTKTRDQVLAAFERTPYRLACTATPSPNDIAELANQAEFLGVATRTQMLATYFTHDDKGWRLKGHAREAFWKWVASWAVALRRPSDLGFDDAGYVLPSLEIRSHLLDVDVVPEGQLFAVDLGGVGGRSKVRRATLADRCARAAELVEAEPDENWLLWVGMNDESREMCELIPDAVEVTGSMSPEEKAEKLLAFADGEIRHLVTKCSIAGYGLNFQKHCARTAFVGLGDSYEQYYQAIRRIYRFGQHRPVDAHIVLSELEGQIAANVRRKEAQASRAHDDLIRHMQAAHQLETAA